MPYKELMKTPTASIDIIPSTLVQTIDVTNKATANVAAVNMSWGTITGILSDQTDLNSALNDKYEKPSAGIPKSDLENSVQASLNLADTALQTHQDISGKQDIISDLDTIRSGAALGATSIQSHQDISGKQDNLVSGTNIKTINGDSILGSGNLQTITYEIIG